MPDPRAVQAGGAPLLDAILDAQAGRPRGFEVLLDLYGARLYGYFLWATGDVHEAEDMVGELMLRVIRRIGNYQHRDRFEPWLFRIAANLVRDRVRTARTRPAPASLSLRDDGEPETPPLLREGDGGPDEPLLRAERARSVRALLDRLDPTTRGMILLRYFGGMTFRELAQTFDCPIGLALVRVHRGIKALRKRAGQLDTHQGCCV